MKNLTCILIASAISISALKADLVDWYLGEFDGKVYTNSSFSSVVPDGTSARFGTFGAGYNFSGKTYADLNNDFIEWDSTTTTSGWFESFNATTTGPFGTPWYFFLGSSSAAFGVFSNPDWTNNGDPFVRQADLSMPTSFAVGGFGTVGTGPNAGNFALVPEPSSLALFGLGAGFLLWRRRRVS